MKGRWWLSVADPAAHDTIRLMYERHANDVFRYARLSLGSDSDAYDVVQEVFLRAFRSWGAFRQEASARTWLMKIARNCIFDSFRKKRSERMRFVRSMPSEILEPATAIDTMLSLEAALAGLKHTYRQVVILRYVELMSVKDTAEILGWSTSKVSVTTHRALVRLREVLSYYGGW